MENVQVWCHYGETNRASKAQSGGGSGFGELNRLGSANKISLSQETIQGHPKPDNNPQTNQSRSMPLLLRSPRATFISFISSLCASGTSLNVRTPQPSLNKRNDPKVTRAQKGSYIQTLSAFEHQPSDKFYLLRFLGKGG